MSGFMIPSQLPNVYTNKFIQEINGKMQNSMLLHMFHVSSFIIHLIHLKYKMSIENNMRAPKHITRPFIEPQRSVFNHIYLFIYHINYHVGITI